MNRYNDRNREAAVKSLLDQEHILPHDPREARIVLWKTFRDPEEALAFSRNILLEKGQTLLGGHCQDSLGTLYWVGVQVENLAAWGHPMAIQLSDPFDATDPKGQGYGIGT